jgi:hypothetical protein
MKKAGLLSTPKRWEIIVDARQSGGRVVEVNLVAV